MLRQRLMPPVPLLIVCALLIGALPVARDLLLAASDKRPIQTQPLAADAGWVETPAAAANWRPVLEGPVQVQVASFSRGKSVVTVVIGYYRDQTQGSELVNSMNRLLPDRAWQWEQITRGFADVSMGAEPSRVRVATLRGAGSQLRVWHWYWLDGRVETSDSRAKLSLALDRLLLRTDTSAWVSVFTADESDADADRVLTAFARDMGPGIQAALEATAAR